MRSLKSLSLATGLCLSFACGELPPEASDEGAEAVQLPEQLSVTAQASRVPQNLRVHAKGGRDVALTWDAVTVAPVKAYRVYRDGVFIGKASPVSANGAFKDTAFYFDAKVVDGKTYKYSVQTVFKGGEMSGQSAAVTATYSNAGVPVPQIILDATEAPELAPYLDMGRGIVETWYPKIGNMLTQPEYQPPATVTLKLVNPPGCGGTGWVSWPASVVNICSDYARNVPGDVSIFVHESTHVLQTYAKPVPEGITEGIASWAGDLAIGRKQAAPGPTVLYTEGYEKMSYFLSWIVGRGYAGPTFIHDLNVRANQGTLTWDFFKTATGRTVGQLWTEMSGLLTSTAGNVVGPGGKCLDVAGSAYGSPMDMMSCGPIDFEQVIFHASKAGSTSGALRVMKGCVESANGAVIYAQCNDTPAQQWIPSADWTRTTLTNVATGTCLMPEPGSTSEFPHLVTGACNGSASQVWALRP